MRIFEGVVLMKKILVPIDGSKPSTEAARKAFEIAKAFDSEITLLTVIAGKNAVPYNIPQNSFGSKYEDMFEELIKMEFDYAHYMFDKIIEELKGDELNINKKVLVGEAAEEILETADSGKFDLIVMGHRGVNPMKRMLVGSVAKAVLEHAPCSVCIVKIERDEIIT